MALVIAGATAACGGAEPDLPDEDGASVVTQINGQECILYYPYSNSRRDMQMECFK
ncbi:hypothetical protein JRC04_05250 [Mycolicibacterium sp. S2-37]|uniref:hypothetical protein n=1 Tax=Mycolicibacterium sp. S2-37 TaxID=2810297 RepID=UPI001A94EE4E|nr:hypothetical protein [Mycolicibacterium sp. S2-37]MBO0676861.1 hypothetical protein [Mycolicibacterium sp. S2-37]